MIFEELGVRLIEVYEMVAETMMNARKDDLITVKERIKSTALKSQYLMLFRLNYLEMITI